ncbi:helix-turn-helix domain-containing protein [Psychroserpens algicola]|uniref:AraC family transcriptional regulator n=1 Tax=Psychroserpens algicola TaxID=1719034 RepID=A0ABT0HCB9_9FLAO|nr:AraC family transcriptional regulator [Psychroserpens algicola]MCK8481997.1 AraC family transcriptional regulator [Psychroserpens algicola]
MIKLQATYIKHLQNLEAISNEIGDKCIKGKAFAYTQLRDEFGKGNISMTLISNDISVIVFEVTFHKEVTLHLIGDASKVIDFIFCLEGHVDHKFGSQSNFIPVNFRQNTIVNRSQTTTSIIKFPANKSLKVSLISYYPDLKTSDKDDLNELRLNAFSCLSDFYANGNQLYSGRVCFRTSNYVNDIMKYGFKTPSEILFKEAAILNTIASQVDRYLKDNSNDYSKAPLRLYEIDKLLALETFIENNLSENLSIRRLESIAGLNASKLQIGFKYLYDKTVSNYVTEKRLEKAAKLIYESDLNVSELVYSVGFSSRSYFSKIFKNHFGVLPSKCISNPDLLVVNS